MKFDLKNKFRLQQFHDQSKELELKGAIVELKEIRQKRSIDANALYWVWLTCLSFETGYQKDDLHRLFRANYLQRQDWEIESIIKPDLWQQMKKELYNFNHFQGLERIIDLISESTTGLDTSRFSEYMKKVQIFSREFFGIILVNLDEANFKEFYREYGYI